MMSWDNPGGTSSQDMQRRALEALQMSLAEERELMTLLRQHERLRFVRELWEHVPVSERGTVATRMLLTLANGMEKGNAAEILGALGPATIWPFATDQAKDELTCAIVARALKLIKEDGFGARDLVRGAIEQAAREALERIGPEQARRALADEE